MEAASRKKERVCSVLRSCIVQPGRVESSESPSKWNYQTEPQRRRSCSNATETGDRREWEKCPCCSDPIRAAARTNSETSKLPQHNFAQAETGKRTAGRFNRQAALSLLSCANNLIFCASIAGLGEHTANIGLMVHLSKPKSMAAGSDDFDTQWHCIALCWIASCIEEEW